MKQLIIKEMESGQRLDKFLGKYLKEAPKSFIYKMLRKKNITLNGKKADGSEKLKTEDVVICGLSVPVCATVWTEIPAVWWRPGKPYRVCRNCPGVFRREVCTNII